MIVFINAMRLKARHDHKNLSFFRVRDGIVSFIIIQTRECAPQKFRHQLEMRAHTRRRICLENYNSSFFFFAICIHIHI